MPFSPQEFQKSINKEFILVKDRVKNLIDIETNHPAEDGNYREIILRNIIKRFLPNNLSVGTGFVISNKDSQIKRTTQIDIIVYDNTYPLLFKEGDFIITTPENVKAIIEVKTTITNSRKKPDGICQVIQKSKANYEIIKLISKKLFNGIFAYQYNDNITTQLVEKSLVDSEGKVNHISLGDNKFIKYWENETNTIINDNCESDNFFNIYNLHELSFAYFISNLIDWVVEENTYERKWFMFPIPDENGKESSRIKQCCI